MVIFTIVVTVITYVSVYLPIKNELQEKTLDNFVLVCQEQEHAVKNFLLKCIDYSQKLSNNKDLKTQIREYYKGNYNKNQLVSYTADLYLEQIKQVRYLMYAYRVIDSQIINQYGTSTFEKKNNTDIYEESYEIHWDNDKLYVIVMVPIKDQEEQYGHDILAFDVSASLNTEFKKQYEYTILSSTNAQKILMMDAKIRKVHNMTLKDDGTYTHYIRKLDNNDYFYVKVKNTSLYQAIRNISFNNLVGFTMSIILVVLIMNWITIKMAQRVLLKSEKSKDKYKEYAIRDTLTGVYSRFFFDLWLKKRLKDKIYNNDLYTVVMIDIDDFKKINDTYGHSVGDKAVITVANILRNSLREDDYVIRYGGDEFLLIMINLDIQNVENILKRIIERINQLEEFVFPISISYGVEETRELSEIEKSIERADWKMYAEKKKKQMMRQE